MSVAADKSKENGNPKFITHRDAPQCLLSLNFRNLSIAKTLNAHCPLVNKKKACCNLNQCLTFRF